MLGNLYWNRYEAVAVIIFGIGMGIIWGSVLGAGVGTALGAAFAAAGTDIFKEKDKKDDK